MNLRERIEAFGDLTERLSEKRINPQLFLATVAGSLSFAISGANIFLANAYMAGNAIIDREYKQLVEDIESSVTAPEKIEAIKAVCDKGFTAAPTYKGLRYNEATYNHETDTLHSFYHTVYNYPNKPQPISITSEDVGFDGRLDGVFEEQTYPGRIEKRTVLFYDETTFATAVWTYAAKNLWARFYHGALNPLTFYGTIQAEVHIGVKVHTSHQLFLHSSYESDLHDLYEAVKGDNTKLNTKLVVTCH